MYLAHYRCSLHKFDALMLEDQTGYYCRRLTRSKCCGSWDEMVKRWKINPREVIDELAEFAGEREGKP